MFKLFILGKKWDIQNIFEIRQGLGGPPRTLHESLSKEAKNSFFFFIFYVGKKNFDAIHIKLIMFTLYNNI